MILRFPSELVSHGSDAPRVYADDYYKNEALAIIRDFDKKRSFETLFPTLKKVALSRVGKPYD